MLGLTVATIVGVPLANWLGQALGWRWGFGVVAVLALLTVALVALVRAARPPRNRARARCASSARCASAQVWLTLAIGAIGFGGMFAVYTYLASTLSDGDARAPRHAAARARGVRRSA